MSVGVLASSVAVSGFAAAMVYSAVQDVLTMTVSDRLVLALLGGFVVLAPLSGWPLDVIAASLAVALAAFFLSIVFFTLGVFGGGDGKLLTAAILWIGSENAMSFLFYMALVGGIFAASLLAFRRVPLPAGCSNKAWVARLHASDAGVPYAVAIGFAGLLVLPETAWMAAFH